VELGGVLPGVAVGGGKADGQSAVNDAALCVQHFAKDHFTGLLPGKRCLTGGPEEPVTAGETPLAGDPDDTDGGGRGTGGNGGNRIHGISSFWFFKYGKGYHIDCKSARRSPCGAAFPVPRGTKSGTGPSRQLLKKEFI
jgi:hypothetical protein